MWPSRAHEQQRIRQTLQQHSLRVRPLPGISDSRALDALTMQFIASLRREAYYKAVQRAPIPARRADPNSDTFDAERAVSYHVDAGNIDEAAWLIFLMTYFARPADSGWLRLRDVYGRLGAGTWDWQTVSANPSSFATWLAANWMAVSGKFGNHRKYESLRPTSRRNMGRCRATNNLRIAC